MAFFPSNYRASRAMWRCGLGFVALMLAVFTAGAAGPPPVVQPLPDKAPAWLDGSRLRWRLRVIGDPAKRQSASVITSLPTGGWLRPDATDFAVQSASGEVLPVTVLSHDPTGETVIQFPRQGDATWYWAY